MPFYETAFQGNTFLALFCAGVLSALAYDLLCLPVRRCALPLRLIMDAAVCCLSVLLCFAALHATDAGEMRLYMAFAFALGAAAYARGLRALSALVINSLRIKRKSAPRGE